MTKPCVSNFISSAACRALLIAGALAMSAASSLEPVFAGEALGYAATEPAAFPQGYDRQGSDQQAYGHQGDGQDSPAALDETTESAVPERLRRTIVSLDIAEKPGTIIIDTGHTYLYLVLGGGRAVRYGVGVGRQGFTWSGTQTISRKAEWPDWYPPSEMVARQPYLPRFMAGGPGNPLGARALYLGNSEYRIHGTNDPTTIGKFVSSGCIRLTNEDVTDLFSRVSVGAKVIVMPKNSSLQAANRPPVTPERQRPVVTALPAGRYALRLGAVQVD